MISHWKNRQEAEIIRDKWRWEKLDTIGIILSLGAYYTLGLEFFGANYEIFIKDGAYDKLGLIWWHTKTITKSVIIQIKWQSEQ